MVNGFRSDRQRRGFFASLRLRGPSRVTRFERVAIKKTKRVAVRVKEFTKKEIKDFKTFVSGRERAIKRILSSSQFKRLTPKKKSQVMKAVERVRKIRNPGVLAKLRKEPPKGSAIIISGAVLFSGLGGLPAFGFILALGLPPAILADLTVARVIPKKR